MFRSILVPYDGSASAQKALESALDLAQATGAQVALLSVEEQVPHFPGDVGEVKDEERRQRVYFEQVQRAARDRAKLRGLEFTHADILAGHAAQTILTRATELQCDLIVMGHSGRSGVWANFLGTTVEKVSRHAHCSVLIVR